jgi:hypothetical protein
MRAVQARKSLAPVNVRPRWLKSSRAWFWCAVVGGIAARLVLAWSSEGTIDVALWTRHAAGVARNGLIEHYASSPEFNHPPPIAWLMAQLWKLAEASGVSFASVFRTLVALGDACSGALLWIALRDQSRRAVAVALYFLAPVAITLAGQHGNTDALIGTCLVASVACAGRGRPVLAGVLLGLSAWIKLPGLLAAPAIGFALPRWRDRIACALAATIVAAVGFVPAYLAAERFGVEHADLVPPGLNVMVERVFGYQGWYIRTLGRPPTYIFGPKNLFFRLFGSDLEHWPAPALWWLDLRARPVVDRSRWVALALMLLLALLRRRERATAEIGATVALCFALFYGLVETWTFQYFGWSMALWMLLPPRSALAAHLIGGGFVYATYAYLCGEPWLLATWDFVGHRTWPAWLTLWRDAATATFVVLGAVALGRAIMVEWRSLGARADR